MAFIFEKLIVYQDAVNLAEKISKLTEEYRRGSYYLADQINRAATSNFALQNLRSEEKGDRREVNEAFLRTIKFLLSPLKRLRNSENCNGFYLRKT